VITLAKRGLAAGKSDQSREVHARRLAASRMARFRNVVDQEGESYRVDAIQKLFGEIAPRFVDRPGGYTRVVKMGPRPGDSAAMAVIMLVDDDLVEEDEDAT
jgi:large subunit ribosomal protein L17